MKDSLFKKVGMTIGRSVALFITFGLVTLVSRLIFKGNLFDEEMLSPRAVAGWNFAFLLFIFESITFAFNRHATEAKRIYLEKFAQSQRFGKVKSVFLTADFYVEFVCVTILSFILPLSFVYDCIGVALFGTDYGKLQVMLVILPILLVLEVVAHLSVRSAWLSESMQVKSKSKKEKNDFARTVQGIAITAMIYCAASLMIPWVLPFVVTIANLGVGAIVFLYIGIALLVAVLVVIALYYVRAVNKRKEFVGKLKKYCTENSITLSEIKKPYASVFVQQEGIDFTIEQNHTIYDCKMVASIFPSSPIAFSDTGKGIRQTTLRLFKVNVFNINTIIDYHMESRPEGNRKIIIALPVPQNIYVSVNGSTPRPADTGENVGEYTLYNASGFLNALERGILK